MDFDKLLTTPLLSEDFLAALSTGVWTPELPSEPAKQPTKPQTRCPVCRNKLHLGDQACKCGLRHCMKHRLPEEHTCSFDHRGHDKALLEKTVVACVRDKLGDERI